MTQEDKELLLKDLSARLPYKVIVRYRSRESKGDVQLGYGNIGYVLQLGNGWWKECKPYLRPMSSMTKEEKKIQKKYIYHFSGNNLPHYAGDFVFEDEVHEYIDWLNARHFDYRGLIEKGLALEALEGMYK